MDEKINLIDTHCHLGMLKEVSLDNFLDDCSAAKIRYLVTIGTSMEDSSQVCEFVSKYEQVYGSLGIHPHEAKSHSLENIKEIKEKINCHQKIRAVGEIGLDYHYDFSPKKIQQECFEAYLQLAIDEDLPIIIHTREAEEDTIGILENFVSQFKKPIVFHSFTSNEKLARWGIKNGFFFGLNGIITFKNAKTLQEVVKLVPQEQILIETDAPFLTPVPYRGKENNSLYLPYILAKIAELKNEDERKIGDLIYKNSLSFFNL